MKQTLLPILAATALLGLAACGSETIDADDLETQLTEQLSADVGVPADDVSVSCPDDVEVEQGRQFDCELTAPNGETATVEVTLTDDEGGFEAEVPEQQFE